jgi:drug/metabolite transporter (DMT)-like permease
VIKWQVSKIAYLLKDGRQVEYIVKLFLNPWVITGLLAAFLAFLSWTVALSKFDLSYAYPFTVISFILVLALSVVFFHEAITPLKVIGAVLIVAGLIIGSQG